MKRFLAIALAATVGLAFASAAQAAGTDASYNTGTYQAGTSSVAAYPAGMAATGVAASRHNLGSMGMAITVEPTTGGVGTSEVCVYCHTPHHSITSSAVVVGSNSTNNYSPAPLWNRRSSAASFTAYGSTIGGTNQANNLQIGGVTLACLSCHDGITTFDNLVNAPGPDGLQGTYGNAGSAGWTYMDEGKNEPGLNTIGGEDRLNLGKGNAGTATNADLSNDHPMSIAYNDGILNAPGNRGGLRNSDTTISSISLSAGLFTTVTELYNNLSQNRWAVKGFISSTATINDLLRGGNVECSSCHDPHFKNLSNIDLDNSTLVNGYDIGGVYGAGTGKKKAADGTLIGGTHTQNLFGTSNVKNDGLFLRRVGGNAGSGVCRTCHNK